MKRFFIPLLAVATVLGIILASCAQPTTPTEPTAPTAPTTPAQPTTPTEPEPTPAVGCTPPARTPPGGATSWVGTFDPDTWVWESVVNSTATGTPPAEPAGIWDGFAVKPDGTPYHFLWEVCTLDMPWTSCASGIAESYIERAGGKVTTVNSNLNTDLEMAGLEDAAVRGDVDAFIAIAIDTMGLIPEIERLADMGYPFFAPGAPIPGPAVVSSCAHDYIRLGEEGGKAFAEYAESINQPIEVYELWGMYGHYDAVERHIGFHKILDGHPLVTVIESGECLFMDPLAQDAVITTFSAHPEWEAIYDMGNMTAGVIEGLRAIDRLYPIGDPRHVYLVSQDESPAAMMGLEEGYSDVCICHSPWETMDGMIKVAFHYVILGQPVARHYNCATYHLSEADCDNPLVWGNALRMDIPFDDCPVYHVPELIETPTTAMRKELCGY